MGTHLHLISKEGVGKPMLPSVVGIVIDNTLIKMVNANLEIVPTRIQAITRTYVGWRLRMVPLRIPRMSPKVTCIVMDLPGPHSRKRTGMSTRTPNGTIYSM